MGLTYPVDIDAWAAWQKRQNTLRWAKSEAARFLGRLRAGAAEQEGTRRRRAVHPRCRTPRARSLLDSFSPTNRNAILEPLKHLGCCAMLPCGFPRTLASTWTDSMPASATRARTGSEQEIVRR